MRVNVYMVNSSRTESILSGVTIGNEKREDFQRMYDTQSRKTPKRPQIVQRIML